jgi:hypothetical protein
MKVPAWLTAFLVLLAVASVGAWMIQKHHLGVPEGFFNDTRKKEQAFCEKQYQVCLDKGYNPEECTTLYTGCSSKAAEKNPDVDESSVTPSYGEKSKESSNDLPWYRLLMFKLLGYEEGFDVASRRANRVCEVAYQSCLNDGETVDTCTTAYNNCQKGIVNPSVSSTPNAPSTAGSAGTSAANPASRDISGSSGYSTSSATDDYEKLRLAALGGQAPDLQKDQSLLTPEFKTFLKQVQGKASQIYPDPTSQQLGLAQGGDDQPQYVSYKPHQTVIAPHQTPQPQGAQITANAPTDRDSGVQQILEGGVLTPSIRQQIRDDVRRAVGEELKTLQSEYEIVYDKE